jgi:predicted unusual protein kinase regulating ubiquinone biosynthesis (AarF/ABC1/UbiB family)
MTRLAPPGPRTPAKSDRSVSLPEEQRGSIGIRGYVRIGRILWSLSLFAIRLFVNTRRWFVRSEVSESELRHREGAALRNKLIALGPTFIKIGQTLATRADILPVEYIQELSKLQDEVPPFPTPVARAIIEQDLRAPVEELFTFFEDTPIAAASLAQVHRATMITGQAVAVKIQRPGLHKLIEFDLTVLRRIARWLERYPNLIRGVEWQATIDEFRATVLEEMDYEQEIRNAEIFRRNFARWREVYVPHVYQVFCSPRVIVMEFVDGLKVTDIGRLSAAGHQPGDIIKLLTRTYLKQLLEDGFFHADPHPGNLRVMPDGRIAFFDFGMVGRLGVELQSKLINAFFHTIERDVHGLVDDLVRLGFISLSPEEESRFKPMIEALMDRYLSLKIGQVKFRELIFDLGHVIYEFPFHIPASFTYIIRAMMTLEGIGAMVDPDFSFFEVARPYAKQFMFAREGRYLRTLLVERLRGNNGIQIEWKKLWKLAKMAVKFYARAEHKS